MQISRYGGVRVVYGRNSHVDTTCHNAAVKGSATAVVSGLSSAAVVIHSECSVCGLQTNEVVVCRNNHAICLPDFSKHIKVLIGNFRKAFIANGCRLSCPYCTPSSRAPAASNEADIKRKCASKLDDATYSLYEECITESAVIRAQQECEKRFTNGLQHGSQDPDQLAVGKMMLLQLLTLIHHHTPPYTSINLQLRHQHISPNTWLIRGAQLAQRS